MVAMWVRMSARTVGAIFICALAASLAGFQTRVVVNRVSGPPVNAATFSVEGILLYTDPRQAASILDQINVARNPGNTISLGGYSEACMEEKVNALRTLK